MKIRNININSGSNVNIGDVINITNQKNRWGIDESQFKELVLSFNSLEAHNKEEIIGLFNSLN